MKKFKQVFTKIVSTVAIAAFLVTGLPNMAAQPTAAAETVAKPTNEGGVELPDNYWNRKVVGYFPNYAFDLAAHKNFDITQLQWDKLTHVQYAFVVADEQTFELVPSAPETDVLSKFEDRQFFHKGQEITMKEGLGYYGQFNLMQSMKELYPDVTVLASTGGWAASRTLWLVCDSEANMHKFAQSAVDFVRRYGFDGLDIDFEFPSETSQSGNPDDFDLSEPRRTGISDRYTKFISILRQYFDEASIEDNTYYWLTSAVSASSWVLGGQTNSDFLDDLDFVSVMSYDYHGGWNNFVENQANIYSDPADRETMSMALPTLSMDWSFKYYRGKVQSEKILMGVPYYTRGWTNVSGGTNGLHGSSNTPATGDENIWHDLDANGNEVPAGANPLWHVLNLMKNDSNYQKYWDPVGCVPYVWNSAKKTFLTFEDEQSIQERINYVDEENLGGVLIWVMHGDYDYDAEKDEYVVGDTLTTMLHDQFEAMGPAEVTTDRDLTAETTDFAVKFGGKYDHPNYVYSIDITNKTGEDITGYTFSFDIPKSAIFAGSWSGTFSVEDSPIKHFSRVTIDGPAWQTLANGATASLTGTIKLNFADVKNFMLNGKAMHSEIEAEKARMARLTGGTYIPTPPPTPETPDPVDPNPETPDPENPDPVDPTPEDPDPVDPTPSPDDTYDATKIYNAGDTVVYLGQTYVCKWWIQGEAPNTSAAWELQAATNPDGTETYIEGKAYTGGALVMYKGVKYKANWWTTATPGTDSSWSVVS